MRHDVDARLAAISAELERRRLIQEEPIDPLSASLFAFEAELAELDASGRDALFEEWCASDEAEGIRPMIREQFDRFIADYSKP